MQRKFAPISKKKDDAIFFSSTPEETKDIGLFIKKTLRSGSVVAFQGDLGAGKTTLIQGFTNCLVNSPTFSYLQMYPGTPPLFHFDLYRLSGHQEFIQMGFLDYFEQEGICCIEWSERISPLLPQNTLYIILEVLSATKRKISLHELE